MSGNALRDAPRHRSALRRVFRIGRGASRTACDAERRTIVNAIAQTPNVPYASVGMPCVTLRVTGLCCTARSGSEAERPER
ncbi:hypothetical protein CVE22_08715, partial [Pseudomonas syringae pv. actinidiae]|nr:hypothetical protein [Pseudomonas syringae pv. actinidiae]